MVPLRLFGMFSTYFWGQMAALLASAGFSLGPTFYTMSGRVIGSRHTLRMRLLLSTLMLAFMHRILLGVWYPSLPQGAWWSLFLSGMVGLALADVFLFEAFVRIGPRLSMLVLTLVPVLTTAAAWIRYEERLQPSQLAAMTLVLVGIVWVVGKGKRDQGQEVFQVDARGVGLALLAAVLGAWSALLAKDGLQQVAMHPVTANLIRMSGGMVPLWLVGLLRGAVPDLARRLAQHPRVLAFLLAGTLAGPVAGMSLQMYAYQTIPLGLASTLTSLPPVLLLPISRWVFRESFTWHAVAGTALATGGVAWLLLEAA